ncbi:MAG: type IV pilus twitching motility protein PilT [Acidimicrobiales bacterium]
MAHEQLDRLLATVEEEDASDLHMKAGARPRIRVNGLLEDLAAEEVLTPTDTLAMARAIMRPHVLDTFTQSSSADFAYVSAGTRFRVNVYWQRETVAIVFRRVVAQPRPIAELHLPPVVQKLADEPRGLVLVTGPTGSGKTTTLAGMVHRINQTRRAHVVTIEDPIEILHTDIQASISQREIGVDTPDFGLAMRAALRQDPDVILVGEMRDQETVATALSAAETGHLVLSTLHTLDAVETVNRIIEFFPPQQHKQVRLTLAASLKGTICQRLIPTSDGVGRVPAVEVMVVNGRVQHTIIEPQSRDSLDSIIADGEYYGMRTFDQSLMELYADGIIELSDALAAATNPHDITVMLRRKGLLGTESESRRP